MTRATAVRVSGLLAPHAWLQRVFNALWTAVFADDISIAVGGSMARGDVDENSDVDIVLVTRDRSEALAVRERVHRALTGLGEIVTAFDASHIGLSCLESTFVVVDGRMTKVDVVVWALVDGPIPVGGVLLHDGVGCEAAFERANSVDDTELRRAPVEVPGWAWYIRSRVDRGECWEAAHALDHMRRRMLVPILLAETGHPQVNYRRIEQRLPRIGLAVLNETYPNSLDPPELRRALRAMTTAFVETLGRIGGDAYRVAARIEPALAGMS